VLVFLILNNFSWIGLGVPGTPGLPSLGYNHEAVITTLFVTLTIRTTCRPFVPWTIWNTNVVWFSS